MVFAQAQPARDGKRHADREHPHNSCGFGRDVRTRTNPGGTDRAGCPGQQQTGRPVDAGRRHSRREPSSWFRRHDPARHEPVTRTGPRTPPLCRDRGERVVGGRHDVCADVGRIHLSGGRHRRLEPAYRWLVHRRAHADRTRARRPEHGDRNAAAGKCHSPQRPGEPVCLARLRQALPRHGRATVDGHGWRCLRQRNGRKLLRQSRMRIARPSNVQEQNRGSPGRLHLDRGLVQPASSSFRAGISVAGQVRGARQD